MSINPDFVAELGKHFDGDILLDLANRVLYSTDASIYRIEPLGVGIPRSDDDLKAAMELATKYHVPILARGAGTSLAGQAIGEAFILDCSRWLDRIVEINEESRTATIQPGVILATLNREAGKYGLQFGPDPASAERATMGGVIANNATGAHSIMYGMAADHLRSAKVVFADGSCATLGEIEARGRIDEETHNLGGKRGETKGPRLGRYEALLAAAHEIRERHAEGIRRRYPRSWRNSAGYRLNYLLPWTATSPPEWIGGNYPADLRPDAFNLAHLLAGSEGTLALLSQATVSLVARPKHTILGIIEYASVEAACDAVPELVSHHPSAIELIPRMILQLARRSHHQSREFSWVTGDPAALLVVEFSGDEVASLRASIRGLSGVTSVAETIAEQASVWNLRKVGLGILDSRPQSARPQAFVEDCAVPVERLGEFVREMQRILAEHDTEGGIYAHASAGCLHIRPILDLRTDAAVRALREIAEQTLTLTLRLGGSMASEHGDGIARGEWLRRTYGDDLVAAMRALKLAADPDGLLSPDKMWDAPAMNSHLRYGVGYAARAWKPAIDFAHQHSLETAIEQCNGQGVCRKDTGVMCPSFQATREEKHSTRGRANLLRALIYSGTSEPAAAIRGRMPPSTAARDTDLSKAVYEALDLCLACKACSAECPSGVDMARLKSSFLGHYFESHTRPLRDYVFGYFHVTAGLLGCFAPFVNTAARVPALRAMAARTLGIASKRPLPIFARGAGGPRTAQGGSRILLLRDPFTHYVEPDVERAALDLLAAAGCDVHVLRTIGAGASLISHGFLAAARQHTRNLLRDLDLTDPTRSLPLLVIEPSELSALTHDCADLMQEVRLAAQERFDKAQSVEAFLVGTRWFADLRVSSGSAVLGFHPHCHESAEVTGTDAAVKAGHAGVELLRGCGYVVESLAAGCCGMAGTFGYEAEHYELSQSILQLRLLPSVRELGARNVAATGAACRMQISQSGEAVAQHPLVFAARALHAKGVLIS